MFKKKQLFILNFIALFAYILGRYVGHLLVLLPNDVSPIWPPAGIALALVLLYGYRVLPGIFLGAFVTQLVPFFFPSLHLAFDALLISLFVTLGVCLQAIFATYLIQRFVGKNDPLIEDLKILKFLFLGSILGSSLSPIFLSIELFYRQSDITSAKLLSYWLTEWSSEAIGILIMMPLLFIFFAKPRKLWKKRCNYVGYPLVLLLILSVTIFNYSKQQEAIRIKEVFSHESHLLDDALFNRLKSYQTVNLILKGFFQNSLFISQEEFKGFSTVILKQYQTLISIEWIPLVQQSERAEFEVLFNQCIYEKNANNIALIAPERSQYYPVAYIEPMQGKKNVLGFNLGSNPRIKKALLLASESEELVVTEKLVLTESMMDGIRFYSAIFSPRQGDKLELRGFVANTFSISNEIKALKTQNNKLEIELEILAGSTVIYSSLTHENSKKLQTFSLLRSSILSVANQRWKINYAPSKNFMLMQKSWGQWWLTLGGFLFTGLTGFVLLMLTGRTLRTEELVRLRTLDLSKAIKARDQHNKVLHAMVSPISLDALLALVVETTEADNSEILCSILLVDESGEYLVHGASGGLPLFYIQAIDGIKIGDLVGSCGTAAYLKKRIIVDNISQHPYWKNFAELAQKANLSACWSEPIMSSKQQILGTFAIYYHEPKSPDQEILDKITRLSQLISLAIEKKTSESKIHSLAFYDALTKLPNRRLLYDRLNTELKLVKDHSNYGALMFLDLDHFKILNDSLGHHIGDMLLIQVAERLKKCVREDDTVARLGGDEFVVLLKSHDKNLTSEHVLDYALMIAERILDALYIPYTLEKYEHVVTSSIGITLFGKDNNNIDNLFKQADTAMYEAKNRGRNTFSFYNNSMAEQVNQRLQLERDLRKAVNNAEFTLYYQAQYNERGHITGAEALLRWIHPEKGIIPVPDFMPMCEESGLILVIAESTLEIICQQLVKWPRLATISLNVSPRHFYQQLFVEQIKQKLSKYSLSPNRLMLEITEEIITQNVTESLEKLNALQDLGIHISIDDFGIGHSSLADLKNLPIDQLKIDQSFIRDVCTDNNVALIVEAMLMMGIHLGLNIIAEGVENQEQIQFLQKNKCYHYQGYYFSKPLPCFEFSQLLANKINPFDSSSQ
ncbi:MAG: EAL domain-containing protein [Methylococcales bacterium]|nr:EAL domain-containing protein [Methylococcales bacterium]